MVVDRRKAKCSQGHFGKTGGIRFALQCEAAISVRTRTTVIQAESTSSMLYCLVRATTASDLVGCWPHRHNPRHSDASGAWIISSLGRLTLLAIAVKSSVAVSRNMLAIGDLSRAHS